MRLTRRPFLVFALAAAAGSGAVAGRAEAPRMAVVGAAAAVTRDHDSGPADDPFPIARVRVAESQLADALKRFNPGPLARLPRDAFEARVRAAARSAAATRGPPRLVEARYTAALVGGDLAGDAEWVVVNPRPRAAVLPLDPLRVGVRGPAWADGRAAVVGVFGAGFPAESGVWVPDPGRHVLRTKWSAAGTGTGADRQFDIRLPPAPAAVLELDLPADRTPAVSAADVLLSGPFPAAGGEQVRRWQVRFGDRTRVELRVRGPGAPAPPGGGVAALAARYDLAPGRAACTFEYDLRPAHGAVGEWVFALSPDLQVTDAVANDRAGWRVDPATRELRVALRQPGGGGKVLITAVAPLPPAGKSAPLPIARPVGAVVADERVEVRVHPDLEVAAWDAGDYRLTESSVAADRGRVMSLVGSLRPAGGEQAFRRPPAVRLRGAAAEFTTTESLDWRVEAGRVGLAARVAVRVTRGPLFRLALRTPPGYTLDRVAGVPEDVVAHAEPAAAPAAGLTVEFARPLLDGQRVELRLAFRGPALAAGGDVRLPFPRFGPPDATERDGRVSFSPGPAWALAPRPAAGAVEADDADDAVAAFSYRGREPDGELILTPVRPAFDADTVTRLGLAGDRVTADSTITLTVRSGALPGVVVSEPGPVNRGRTWRVAGGSNAVAGATPVAAGGLTGLAPLFARPWGGFAPAVAARAGAAAGSGTDWVVRFARPVEGAVTLETAAVGPAVEAGAARRTADDWAAGRRPFLAVRGAGKTTARFDRPPVLGGGDTPPPGGAGGSAGWSVTDVYLVTVCGDPDPLVVFGGTVAGRGGAALPVRLPAGAAVRAAAVGTHWLDPGRCTPVATDAGAELRLPLPATPGPVRFEVRYRMPAGGGAAGRRVASPVPGLPDGAGPPRRWWVFPRDSAAAWPPAVRAATTPADFPTLLGGPPDGDGAVVSGYAGDAVVVAPARVVAAGGYGLAAVLAAVGWVGARRRNRAAGVVLLAAVGAAGVAALGGPPAWARAAVPALVTGLPALAAVVVARGRARRESRPPAPAAVRPSSAKTQIVVATLLLIGAFGLVAARAQPAAGDVVFILPGPADAPGRETVLAPRALLDALDALGRPPEPDAVVTAAAYDGRAEDGFARFTARFVVHAFRDGDAVVSLPLADVRLEQVTVGGKPAAPVAARPDVYAVTVTGRGRHEIEARFAVPILTTGPDREARFGVPEVADSRLAFAAPDAARQVQAVGRFGGQTTSPGAAPRLDADLGPVRAVQVRWRQGAGGAATVTVREGCVWDVTEAGAALTACYQVRVEAGSVTGFRFDLPPDLDPVRVTARSLDPAPGPGAAVRDWSVAAGGGGGRAVRVDLLGPSDGRFLVVLECVPRGAPTRWPVLRFPRPVGMTGGGVYGLRATGVAVEAVTRTGTIDFAADALVREFGAVPDLRLTAGPPVLTFSPRPGEAAELRPTLRPGPAAPTATVTAAWRVGPHRADGAGEIRWTAADPHSLVEFAVPGATVFEVRGADVGGWAQADGRVQVWLRKPARGGAVEWVAGAVPSPPGKPPPDPLVFEPHPATVFNMRTASQVVRVVPADGWAVRVDRERGWKAEPTGPDRGRGFHADGPLPPVRLHLFPPRVGAVRGVALVEAGGPGLTYRGTVDVALPPGRPHHLVLRVAGLPPGSTVTPDLPPGVAATDRPGGDGDDDGRAWDLDVPAAAGQTFRAAVVVRFPATGAARLPVVWCGAGGDVPDPAGVVRWVGVGGGRGARLDGATAASPADLKAVRALWPGEAERLARTGGSLWTAGAAPPVLTFDPPEAVPPKPATPPATPPAEAAPPVPSPPRPPVLPALGWGVAVLGLGALFVKLPRSTWPEQVAGLAALFGVVVGAGAVAGLVALALARATWLADAVRR